MAQNPLLGSRISLISKRDIRYEGMLYSINEADATVALQNVRSYGTEGRERQTDPPGQYVAPTLQSVHQYLVFRGCDIKDLHVHDKQDDAAHPVPEDPAIVATSAPPPPNDTEREKSNPANDEKQASGETIPKKIAGKNGINTNGATEKKIETANEERNTSDPVKVAQPTKEGSSDQFFDDLRAPSKFASREGYNGNKRSNGGRGRGNTRRKGGGNSQIGTGASLLNRKARGAVDGAQAPKTGKDFDFESSTAGFDKDANSDNDADNGSDNEGDDGVDGIGGAYTKDNFFDSISCDAIDKRDGVDNRLRGAAERSLNMDTFGAMSLGNNRRNGPGGRRYRRRTDGRGGRGGRYGGRGRGRGNGEYRAVNLPPQQNRRWQRGNNPGYGQRPDHFKGSNSVEAQAPQAGAVR